MKIQFTLNENNPFEKKIADLIESRGTRSGLPKQLFIDGFLEYCNEYPNHTAVNPLTKPVKSIPRPPIRPAKIEVV